VTLVYGIIDSDNRTFTYANAGHEHPLLRRQATGDAQLLDVTGPAIALKGSIYRTRELDVEAGDVLVLYTDGITDAGTGRDRLGQERLRELLAMCGDGSVEEFVVSTMSLAQDYAGGRLADDAALLAIKAL
jgi:sigma-B regulation protein RsbU (phosphoserine phosphatase)